jgi:hypothetical protein
VAASGIYLKKEQKIIYFYPNNVQNWSYCWLQKSNCLQE